MCLACECGTEITGVTAVGGSVLMGSEEAGSSLSSLVDYLETCLTMLESVDWHEGINALSLSFSICADVPNADSVDESLCNGCCSGSMPVFEGGLEWTCCATNKTAMLDDSTVIAVMVPGYGRCSAKSHPTRGSFIEIDEDASVTVDSVV